MAQNSDPSSDIDQDSLWNTGRAFALSIGAPPLWLTSTVRALRNAVAIFGGQRSEGTHEVAGKLLQRLLKAPTMSSIILKATSEYYQLHLADYQGLSADRALRFFSADELTSILTLSYLARRLRRATNDEAIGAILARARTHIALGRVVGESIPEIGGGAGMLAAGLRYLSLACFLTKDPKGYSAYRPGLRSGKNIFDEIKEIKIFSTSHSHIAASLAQLCGFGIALSSSFVFRHGKGIDSMSKLLPMNEIGDLTEKLHQASGFIASGIAAELGALQQQQLLAIEQKVADIFSNPEVSAWLLTSADARQEQTELSEE